MSAEESAGAGNETNEHSEKTVKKDEVSKVTSSEKPKVVRHKSSSPLILAVVVVVILVAAGVGAAWVFHVGGWGAPPASVGSCPSGITLQGEGASLVSTLVSAWIPQYHSASNNTVNYNPAGSGAGVTQLTDKLTDFAASDVPLSSSQSSALPAAVLTIPITGIAITVMYNLPGVTGHLNLTGAILADIYLGNITNWNNSQIQAINPGVSLPSEQIITVHRTDSSGATYVFTEFLSEESTAWAAPSGPGYSEQITWPNPSGIDAVGEGSGSKLITEVTSTDYSIGYTDLADAESHQYASIENPSGDFIVPTASDTASAIEHRSQNQTLPNSTGDWFNVNMLNSGSPGDYPIATLAYFFVYTNDANGYEPSKQKAEVLHQWLEWVVTSGQPIGSTYDYIALSSQVVSIDETGLGTMTYNGGALPSCS